MIKLCPWVKHKTQSSPLWKVSLISGLGHGTKFRKSGCQRRRFTFSLDSDKQRILNHSFRSEFSFHLASGQGLDDILNWFLVVYDANWHWSSLLYDIQPLIFWRDMELTFDKPFMIKLLQRNEEEATQDTNRCVYSEYSNCFLSRI